MLVNPSKCVVHLSNDAHFLAECFEILIWVFNGLRVLFTCGFLETSWDAVLEEGPLLDTDLEVSVPLGTFYLLDTCLNCIPV